MKRSLKLIRENTILHLCNINEWCCTEISDAHSHMKTISSLFPGTHLEPSQHRTLPSKSFTSTSTAALSTTAKQAEATQRPLSGDTAPQWGHSPSVGTLPGMFFSFHEEILVHDTTRMNLEDTLLRERVQSRRVKCCITSLVSGNLGSGSTSETERAVGGGWESPLSGRSPSGAPWEAAMAA